MTKEKPKLSEIENFFKTFDFNNPWPQTFDLDKCGKIFDLKKFVDSHIATLKSNPKNKRFEPYYDRLLNVYLYFKKK